MLMLLKNLKMLPYKNYTNVEMYDLLILQTRGIEIMKQIKLRKLIGLAFADNWSPVNDFDGCTVVQDDNHPSLSCFVHDWLWITGKGGKASNKLFYDLMLATGVSKGMALTRYYGVQIAWYLVYRFKSRSYSRIKLDEVMEIWNFK